MVLGCLVAWLLGFGGSLAMRPSPTDLTASQREAVDRGEVVLLAEQRPTSPWPAVTIYVFTDASPEAAAAVFMDYESHTTFIPSLTHAKISKVIDRATVEVDYSVRVPVFPDEDYTVRNHLTHPGTDYRFDWTLVRASSTKATVGYAVFRPWVNQRTNQAGTLLEYYNFVTPGSKLAGLPFIKSRSVREITETAKAVAHEAEKQRGRDPEMRPRLAALRSAVAP
jgi:hypothetical protein